MRVSELMQSEVWQTFLEESLADAASRMRDHGVGSLAVMDGEELVGILTERDLAWAMADGAPAHVTRVWTYMSAPPVVVSPETTVVAAGRLMVEHDIRHLPVVREGQLAGMISATTCSSWSRGPSSLGLPPVADEGALRELWFVTGLAGGRWRRTLKQPEQQPWAGP
jgi:signal-transduction protein with cAMP-binding, CBS, and nucleotidyltransferase domain